MTVIMGELFKVGDTVQELAGGIVGHVVKVRQVVDRGTSGYDYPTNKYTVEFAYGVQRELVEDALVIFDKVPGFIEFPESIKEADVSPKSNHLSTQSAATVGMSVTDPQNHDPKGAHTILEARPSKGTKMYTQREVDSIYRLAWSHGASIGRKEGFDTGVDTLRKAIFNTLTVNDTLRTFLEKFNVWPKWVDLYRLQLMEEAAQAGKVAKLPGASCG